MVDRGVLGDVEDPRRLPHRRTGRDDRQISFLETRGEIVEMRESTWDPGDARSGFLQPFDVLEGGPEDLLDPHEAFAVMTLRHPEDPLLGLVEHLFHRTLALFVHVPDNLGGGVDQSSQQSLFTHDAGVILDVRGRGYRVQQLRQVLEPPSAVQLFRLAEVVADGNHVDDVASLEEPHHRPEDASIRLPVEHRVGHDLDRERDRFTINEHAPQHGDLGFEGIWRLAIVWRRDRGGQRCARVHARSAVRSGRPEALAFREDRVALVIPRRAAGRIRRDPSPPGGAGDRPKLPESSRDFSAEPPGGMSRSR